jgi:hypothetical protein
MFEKVLYILKLHLGIALISFIFWKLRFWSECDKQICFWRHFYLFFTILLFASSVATALKSFDLVFIIFLISLFISLDFFVAKRGKKFEIFKITLNQKIYDLLDGNITLKVKPFKTKINITNIIAVFTIYVLGLFMWVKPALENASFFNLHQHNLLVKTTSILTNSANLTITNLGICSLSAFFASIFGVNQHQVIHLFGAFNFMLLFSGVSILTFRLTNDLKSVILSGSIIAFVFPHLNLVSNPVEGSSFLLGISWALFILYFWKDEDLNFTFKLAGILSAFLIDLFTGFILSILILTGEIFEIWKRKGKIFPIFLALLIFPSLLVFELFILRRNPELMSLTFALLYNQEIAGVVSREIQFFSTLVSLLGSIIGFFSGLMFYSISTLSLIVLILLCEFSILNFIPYEQLYPLAFILSVIWLSLLISKILKSEKTLHDAITLLVASLVSVNGILAGSVKLDATVEPDEFVILVEKIRKDNLPFSFAIVSHRGTRAMVENWAWFMDWEYFAKNYILIDDVKNLYDVIYVLVPEKEAMNKINRAFLPPIENPAEVLDSICVNYKYARTQIYFKGRYVKAYKLMKLKSD